MSAKNGRDQFPESLIRDWENNDGVNFAIALARITGWLLHVDWWAYSQDEEDEKRMKSIRVYIATDTDVVFDFRGRKRVYAFNEYTILPIVKKRLNPLYGGVLTRFYSEEKLKGLPLRVKPSEAGIVRAIDAIKKNTSFLDKIPKRLNTIPADRAAQFSFGWCSVYAEVLHEVTSLPVMGIMAKKYSQEASGTPLGYCHSVILHSDGDVEDSWGKQPLENVLLRFGILEYELNPNINLKIVEKVRKNSEEIYLEAYNEAIGYLKPPGL